LNPGATGTPPLAYSWNFNTTQLTNTDASLYLTNITPLQSGFYSVIVTNQYGSVSSTGRISVFSPASSVMAWGDDSGGQTDVPASLDDAVAIAGGDYHSVAIRHDGTLVAWGFDDEGQIDVPTNSLPFVSVAAGADHNLAIAGDGSVVAWGLDDSGQTDVPGTVSSALSVAAGDSHSLALLSSGTVVAWGNDTYGQTDIPLQLFPGYWVNNWWWGWVWVNNLNWMPVEAIAAGRNHSLALLTNGTVVAWGDNSFGQASPPSNLSNVVGITAGYLHSAALCSNGTVVVWGDDTFGQTNVPTGLSNVVAIAAGDFHTFALCSNGRIVAWGDNTFGQMNVPSSVTNVVGIASGYYHGLALAPFIQLLQLQLTRNGLVLNWNGTGVLQWAPAPTGPYTDVPFQGNSWTNLDMSAPAKFFRVRR
jgi:alpha-tubulin suppressor-like RCC1 family protein